ncbi:MAG: hypothetical protein JKY42_05060 [Flavobacteriales bacterium]|nr:hypothetical protein [Flavobacteriales bacterium]
MYNIIERFKSDFFSATFELTKAVLWKSILIYIITMVAYVVIFIPALLIGFGIGIDEIVSIISISQDPNRVSELANLFSPEETGVQLAITAAIIIPLALFLTTWSYIAYFSLNDQQIRTNSTNFSEAIKAGFSNKTWSMLGSSLLLLLIYIFGIGISVGSFTLSGILGFLVMLGALGFLFKFSIATSSIVHGNKGGAESIAYSSSKISVGKAYKLFGISILVGIVLLVAMLLITGIIWVISLIPAIGIILGQVLNYAIQAAVSIFVISALSGLYFRYSEEVVDENTSLPSEENENLLDSNLS